jgi:hypothetical protein
MSEDDIVAYLHHPESCLPPIHPCDTPNLSKSKTTYTPEELHRLTGCHQFRNYQHIITTTNSGTLINTGEFPLSLGTYATIPKAAHGKPIDRLPSKYLDVIHIDIAFGDCVSVGGYKFTLVFVDRATRYNWTFGFKSLQHKDIQAAFLAFRDEAGALARQSNVTAMRNFLAAWYNYSSTPTTHLLPQVWWDTILPTALSRPPGRTLLKSKCPKHSGIMPSSTPPE